MSTGATLSSKPWYREPWPWLIMAGPATVLVAGVYTVWLAVVSNDGLVADDYYKQGLAINQTLGRDRVAQERGFHARLLFSPERDRVRVMMAGAPEHIRLTLRHPTRAGMDVTAVLNAVAPGVYDAPVPPPVAGRWRVEVEDAGRTWRLAGDWQVPGGLVLDLPPVAQPPR